MRHRHRLDKAMMAHPFCRVSKGIIPMMNHIRSMSTNIHSIKNRPSNIFISEEEIEMPAKYSSSTSSSNNEEDHQQKMADILRPYHQSQSPLVLRKAISKMDAIYCWKNWDYLRLAVGEETLCSVEIGGSYNDNNNSSVRPEISFGQYIEYIQAFEGRFSASSSDGTMNENTIVGTNDNVPLKEELVYLAQNDLFPGLAGDIDVPHFCSKAHFNLGEGKLYSTMIWMGPHGCISPLHFDPMDNVFMQILGRKRILLFPPVPTTTTTNNNNNNNNGDESSSSSQPNYYYAGFDDNQYNTSPIDVEHPNLNKYPLFLNAPPAMECLLNPGDILFIPKKWWHHVRSIDTSISVNTWWR